MKFDLIKQDFLKLPISKKETITLYRIIALEDFSNHTTGTVVKKFTIGGYVERLENLDNQDGSWIADSAKVYGTSRISGDSWIDLNANVINSTVIASKIGHQAFVQDSQITLSTVERTSKIATCSVLSCKIVGNCVIKGLNKAPLEVSNSTLKGISYIVASGKVTESSLEDGAGIMGADLRIDKVTLGGVATLTESASNVTKFEDANLGIESGS